MLFGNQKTLGRNKSYFEEVYREYFDRLFGFALVITKSETLAKDAVSEVFFNLWNSQTDLSTLKELKAYLFASVKNQAIRSLSKDPTGFESENYEQLTSSIDKVSPEDLLVGKELDQFITKLINELPPQCALVFKMVKQEQMSYEKVALELGVSIDTVKYHIKVALKKIRTDLEEHFKDTPIIKWISTGCWILYLSISLLIH